ncbi:hypothetical protein C4D60_Mb11t01590 [Musa balbisiana]|uniref:Uncharacterized protein n=1 Tax=Musa balbisiana TaxID=52838 RepID=A0A4S8J110_MUSBA|nr:hypothetical protein C4D60_Mb11t01590 [Musa balbisiana]
MLRRMADRFTGLLELDLSQSAWRSFYPGVTDSDFAVIAAGFRKFRVIDLQNCKVQKGYRQRVVAIAMGFLDLKRLYITRSRSVTDELLKAVSKSWLAGRTNITDTGLLALAVGCRYIKVLDMSKLAMLEFQELLRLHHHR